MGSKAKTNTYEFTEFSLVLTPSNSCFTGFKIGINWQPPQHLADSDLAASPRSVCMLSATSAISEPWSRINHKFDLMYHKRAFLHWWVNPSLKKAYWRQSCLVYCRGH